MSLASRIVDRLVLKASRHPVDPEQRRRIWVDSPVGRIEVWIASWRAQREQGWTLALKFPGAGGRAERGGPHPLECWPDTSADIWTVNMPGYGSSAGQASLSVFHLAARAVWDKMQALHPDIRPLIVGNSIGCSPALALGACVEASGLFLRNPVPLKELIHGRHSWWNGGWVSRWLTRSLPPELDPVTNAGRCRVPAFFFQSAADRLVPAKYQQLVISAYGGPKTVFLAQGLDHHEALPEDQRTEYRQALEWLIKRCPAPPHRHRADGELR
jgi:hypothetical protein